MGRAIKNIDTVSEPSKDLFIKYYIQAKEIGNKLNIKITTSASNSSRIVTSFCGAMSIPSFTITTKGIVTTCERDSTGEYYWYGKYSAPKKDFVLDNQRIEYNKSLLNLPKKCYNCFCKWHCAGDCPDIRNVNYERCYINKKLLQYELESMIDKNRKGVINYEAHFNKRSERS